MAIKVYNKNAKVVILLSTGVSYVDENDGSFLAESDTSGGQGQLKIKDVANDRYIAVQIPFAQVQGADGTAIGTDAATTITNLNERYFDVADSILIKFKVYAATAHSKGSLLNIYSLYKQGFISTKSANNNTANGLAFAMATDAAAAGDIGEAISVGHFSGVDTSGMSVGDTIYLDSTPGQFTNVRPSTTGDIIQALGYVTKVGSTDGEVFLNITSDYSTHMPSVPVSGVDFDPVGTDNSTDVTLAGAYNYLTLSGQQITLDQVDYNTDISNTPSIPVSGVDFDPVGTDNSTDVTLAGAYNYLTLLGQQITLGQVDYTTDISNTPSIPVSGVDFDPVGTDNSTDVTLAGAYNYLTLLGQQITLGQVDYTTDISNTPTIPTSGVDFDPVGTDNSTDVSLSANVAEVLRLSTGQILSAQDAGEDKIVFWDDSAGKLNYAKIGTNLTMTGDTLSASGGGGSANMENSKTSPSTVGAFNDGARLLTGHTSQSITAGNLVSMTGVGAGNVGAQSAAAAATSMLFIATDAANSNELLIEGVVKLSTTTTTSLLPTNAKVGSPVYMSTTAGAVQAAAPSTAGEYVRVVGHVLNATDRVIYFNPSVDWIEL